MSEYLLSLIVDQEKGALHSSLQINEDFIHAQNSSKQATKKKVETEAQRN